MSSHKRDYKMRSSGLLEGPARRCKPHDDRVDTDKMAELLAESKRLARPGGSPPATMQFEPKRWRSVDKAFDVLKLQKALVFPRHAPTPRAPPRASPAQADPDLVLALQRELLAMAPGPVTEPTARKTQASVYFSRSGDAAPATSSRADLFCSAKKQPASARPFGPGSSLSSLRRPAASSARARSTVNEALNALPANEDAEEPSRAAGRAPRFRFLKTKVEVQLEQALARKEAAQQQSEEDKQKQLYSKLTQMSQRAKCELLGKVNAFNTLSIYNLCDGAELFSFKSINVTTKKTIDPPVQVGSIDLPQTKLAITRHIVANKHAKTTRERLIKEAIEMREPNYLQKTLAEVRSDPIQSDQLLLQSLKTRADFLKALPEPTAASKKFIHAVIRGQVSSMYRMISEDRDVIHGVDIRCNTPLHYAVLYDNIEAVEFLLKRGADPFAANLCDQSPIGIAEKNGRRNIVDLIRGHLEQKKKKPLFGDEDE